MARVDTDYLKVVLYCLKCKSLSATEVYVGCTVDLKARKYAHKNCSTNENRVSYDSKLYKYVRNNGGISNFEMIELEKFPCNSEKEPETRERY